MKHSKRITGKQFCPTSNWVWLTFQNIEDEIILRKAIKGRGDNLYIATKNHYKGDVPNGSMDEPRRAKEIGLIRHLRFSSHDEPENIIKLIDTDEPEGIR